MEKTEYQRVCINCGAPFTSHARGALYCPACRAKPLPKRRPDRVRPLYDADGHVTGWATQFKLDGKLYVEGDFRTREEAADYANALRDRLLADRPKKEPPPAPQKKREGATCEKACPTCGKTFTGFVGQTYCSACAASVDAGRHRDYYYNGPPRPIGSKQICEKCGKPYVITGSRQRFCPNCSPHLRRKTAPPKQPKPPKSPKKPTTYTHVQTVFRADGTPRYRARWTIDKKTYSKMFDDYDEALRYVEQQLAAVKKSTE